MQQRNVVVTNTILAAGADISILARALTITGAPAPIGYPAIINAAGPKMSLVSAPNVLKLTYSAVNSTTYSFTIQQNTFSQDNLIKTWTISFTSDTSATLAETQAAIIAAVNTSAGIQIVASASGNDVLLTANAGYELFSATNITNITVASNMALTPTIASNTTAASTVFTTTAPHGLVVGNVITITTSDVTKFVAGTYRVMTVPLATTFTLASVDGQTALAGTATATGTMTLVPEYAFGTATTINADIALGVTNVPAAPTAGHTYTKLSLFYNIANNVMTGDAQRENQLDWYYDEGAANYSGLVTRINEVLHAWVASATTADPEFVGLK